MIATANSTTTRQTVTSTADDLPQYRPRQIIGIWLAATVPISLSGRRSHRGSATTFTPATHSSTRSWSPSISD